jgi:metal-sulfur cluster biosynthetic enzyme
MSDSDILDSLSRVRDPELGVNIVDLGLVYRAERSAGAIRVEMTTTVPTCPASDMLIEEARGVLSQQFPDVATIEVQLVWEPAWSPARMNDAAREQLGWKRGRAAEEPRPSLLMRWTRAFTRH